MIMSFFFVFIFAFTLYGSGNDCRISRHRPNVGLFEYRSHDDSDFVGAIRFGSVWKGNKQRERDKEAQPEEKAGFVVQAENFRECAGHANNYYNNAQEGRSNSDCILASCADERNEEIPEQSGSTQEER